MAIADVEQPPSFPKTIKFWDRCAYSNQRCDHALKELQVEHSGMLAEAYRIVSEIDFDCASALLYEDNFYALTAVKIGDLSPEKLLLIQS